jgi:hypothetical protein
MTGEWWRMIRCQGKILSIRVRVHIWDCGVVVSHPLCMRRVPGSNPGGSILFCPQFGRWYARKKMNSQTANNRSRQWGSNPRPYAYEAHALPLSYSGMCMRRVTLHTRSWYFELAQKRNSSARKQSCIRQALIAQLVRAFG